MTRNDAAVVSFFEKTRESGLLRETRTTRARNIETASGRDLGWSDVCSDPKGLPALLDAAFRQRYPDLRFNENTEQLIRDAIEGGENLFFALSDGAVRVVAAEYDTVYCADGIPVSMSYTAQGEYGEEIVWKLTVNGSTITEKFFPNAPECRLIRANDRNYVYLTMPASDVTMRTFVYELTADGAEKLGEAPMAMQGTTCLDPGKMQMALDELLYVEPIPLLTVGTCRVGADGMPELAREDYAIRSSAVELTNFASAPTVDLSKPDTEGEKRDVPAGTLLTAFRTDRKSYLDFLDADGVAVRFRITEFGENMELVDYGKPGELFRWPDDIA